MNKVVQTSTGTSGSSAGVRIPTTTVTMKEKFKCTLADLYRALTVKGVSIWKYDCCSPHLLEEKGKHK